MSNHYHIVLRVDVDKALAWPDEEIIERWGQLHHLPLLVQRFCRNSSSLDQAEIEVVDQLIEEWRERLYSISWFMKHLNEYIARLANREDNCTGHFWCSFLLLQKLHTLLPCK